MRKIIAAIIFCMIMAVPAFALDDAEIHEEQTVQARINKVGTNILNANKIDKRIIFVYDKNAKDSLIKMDKTVTSRQIVMYKQYYKDIADDNELAAYLARGIVISARTYRGFANG